MGQAVLEQTRFEEIIDNITAKGEECLLIGDLNRNVDKPKKLTKTRLMQSWFHTGKVQLLNYTKIHTRIDPVTVTGRGSTLDMGVSRPGLRDRLNTSKWITTVEGHYTVQ